MGSPQCTVLISARGRGKELKDNSLIPVGGRPLIWYAVREAKASALTSHVYLTTESAELAQCVEAWGVKAIVRPEHLKRPSTSHADVVMHAVEVMEADGHAPDFLANINGNIATLEPGILDSCLEILIDNPTVDTVVTVTEMNEYHPLRAKRLRLPVGAGQSPTVRGPMYIEPYLDIVGKVSTNRQDLENAYFLNFAVVALRVSSWLGRSGQWPHGFCGGHVVGIENEHCHDIFNEEDIAFTEEWLRRRDLLPGGAYDGDLAELESTHG